MNSEKFAAEIISETPIRRTSDRRKTLTLVDKSFFKKTYKAKPLPSCEKVNKIGRLILEPNPPKVTVFENATSIFFKPIKPDRRQAKAIHTFRTKKLKNYFSNEESLKELIANNPLLGQYSYLAFQEIRRRNPSGKSVYASSRARDNLGRFNGVNASQRLECHETGVDMRDECGTVTHTTADGSYLSLLSFDKSAGKKQAPAQIYHDFDSLCGVSQPDHQGGLIVKGSDEVKAKEACDFRTHRVNSPLEPMEQCTAAQGNHNSCLHQGLFWELGDNEENPLDYPHLQNDILNEILEEDHAEDLFL